MWKELKRRKTVYHAFVYYPSNIHFCHRWEREISKYSVLLWRTRNTRNSTMSVERTWPPSHPHTLDTVTPARQELESPIETITALESNTITKERRKAWSTPHALKGPPGRSTVAALSQKKRPTQLNCHV